MNENEQTAADVTGNGKISGLDASRVVRYALGIMTYLNESGNHWKFSPSPAEYLYLDSDKAGQNFLAMRLGDVSGNYMPESLSARTSSKTSEFSETSEIFTEQDDSFSVPVLLEYGASVEGIDIAADFDRNIFEMTGASLSGGIFEYADYELTVNTAVPGKVSLMLFARSEPITGSGTVVTLNFRITGEPYDGAVIDLTKFVCNETPVYEGKTKLRFVLRSDGTVFSTEAEEDLMQYDFNNDGKVGLQDAVYALSIGDLKTAIRVLQVVTGIN